MCVHAEYALKRPDRALEDESMKREKVLGWSFSASKTVCLHAEYALKRRDRALEDDSRKRENLEIQILSLTRL